MSPTAEKRLLQLALALALPLSVVVAARSIATGPASIGAAGPIPPDLDSHFRYLSGIFAGMLAVYASCIPRIEHKGARLRLMVALTVAGGCARLVSLAMVGPPSTGHLAGLGIELGVAPLILLWQARVARRMGR